MARPKKSEQNHSLSTADLILHEAKRLFRHNGYNGVSINDIIEACGITKPTLYHHFGDKENLYARVLIKMMENGYHHHQPYSSKEISIEKTLMLLTQGFLENSPTSLMAMLRDASLNVGPDAWQDIEDAFNQYILAPFESLFCMGIQRVFLEQSL